MDDPDSTRSIAQYYGGRIHCFISKDEVSLTFCESYEGYWVLNQPSRINPDGTVQYFQKSSHSLRRKSRGYFTRGFSANATLHKAHRNQVSLLMDFNREW